MKAYVKDQKLYTEHERTMLGDIKEEIRDIEDRSEQYDVLLDMILSGEKIDKQRLNILIESFKENR